MHVGAADTHTCPAGDTVCKLVYRDAIALFPEAQGLPQDKFHRPVLRRLENAGPAVLQRQRGFAELYEVCMVP